MPKLPKNHKYQQISLDQKKKIIDEVNNKQNSIRSIAAKLQISRSTVHDIVKRFDMKDRVVLKSKGGDKRSILTENHKDFLSKTINKELYIIIVDLTKKLINKYPQLEISNDTIRKYVNKIGFTLKRLVTISHKHNTSDTILDRKRYVEKIYQKVIDMLKDAIYINETGFNLHLSSSHSYSL
ncbi:5552_t:CDS:2 [Cetraspora pellucida]|uniref:5552_t:CDS:1 n=1 Tax=Cetraspora pellucida TaxID=1433469 RepID=A0A9N9ABZ6_9GLOM|nr:5552_t:CDS:2 [Cetraspora pellucida]